LLTLLRLLLIGRAALVAENLFLRKQLALLQERKARPRKAPVSTRLSLMALARFFDWHDALVIVKPATFIGWHRTAFRAFWHWKSRKPGRPPLPENLRELVREMAAANPTWGEERIAHELSLKLSIRVSPRTVGSTWTRYGLGADALQISVGPLLFGITPRASSPATSWSP